jgi:hypothetical protein
MTEEQDNADLAASWLSERRWFRWTVGFSVGMCLCMLGWWAVMFWFHHQVAKFGSMKAGQLGPIFLANAILSILIVGSGFGFIVTFVKWLLAIRTRRKMQMSVGFQAGQDR